MTEDVRINGGWNPRLSPSGRNVLSTWIGEPDAHGVRPTASIVNRQVICAGGDGGDWLNETTVVIANNDNGGRLLLWSIGDAEPKPLHGPIAIGGNVIAAASGMLAISRTDPPRTLIAAGDVTELLGFVQPALSDSGEDYAYLRQDDSALFHHGHLVDERACFNPAFGSETLAYECDSRIYGFTTLGQPRIDLTIPGLPMHRPIPIWTGRDLVVLSHTNTGVILQQWGSSRGWTVYQGITGGPHHARALDATHVRCVWSVRGVLQEQVIDLDSATIDLTPHDDEWTDTAPIDLLPLIVGDESRWPRHGSHDLHQTWDGRNLHLIKFSGPDNWERWELAGDQFYLREDRSQSGAGDYSFHPGTWFGRHMTLGQWITVPDNQIQRYEPQSCTVQSVSRFPYRVGLVRAWRRLDCGGDIGIVERTSKPAAVLLAYDPGGLHDTIETYLMVDGWGLAKWRVQNQDYPSTYHETVFTFLGGTRVTPTQGCYKALQTMSHNMTLVEPASWPQTIVGTSLRCRCAPDGGAWAPWVEWIWRRVGESAWQQADDRRDPQNDDDHTFRFPATGDYEVGLRWDGGQTGRQRVVHAQPAVPAPAPGPAPTPTPVLEPTAYDYAMWLQIAVQVAAAYREGHTQPAAPPNLAHAAWCLLAEGWRLEDVLQDMAGNPVTPERSPRPTPSVDYATFVQQEAPSLASAYQQQFHSAPAAVNLFHAFWRRLQEQWPLDLVRRDFIGEHVDPPPPPKPDPVQTPTATIQGRLRIENGRPRDDSGYLQVRAISEFDFIHRVRIGDEADVIRRRDRAVTIGARNMFRVFMRATVLFDLNDHQSGYWEAADRVVALCNEVGARVEFVIFCDTKDMSSDERSAFLDAVLARYAQHPGVVLQIVNEPGQAMQNNWHGATDPELLAYADRIEAASGHRDFSIGDATDGEDPDASEETMQACVELAQHSNIIVLHSSRTGGANLSGDRFRRWIDHMEGFFDIVSECRKVNPNAWGWHDEPMGFASTSPVAGHERETDPEAALAGEFTAQMIGCGFTYHYISAQNDGTPGIDACGAYAPRLPSDPSWSYRNDSWGGSATRGYSGWGKVRTWTNGHDAFVLASGTNKGSIVWANGFQPVETLYDGVHIAVWRAQK